MSDRYEIDDPNGIPAPRQQAARRGDRLDIADDSNAALTATVPTFELGRPREVVQLVLASHPATCFRPWRQIGVRRV